MKSFAKGSKKRLGGSGRSSSKKKRDDSEDGGLGDMFGNISSGEHSDVQGELVDAGTARSSGSVFQLPYPASGSQSLGNDAFGSYSPTQEAPQQAPRSSESAGQRGSVSSSGSASRSRRRSTRTALMGDRPSLTGIGFPFQQPPEEDTRPKGNSGEIQALLAEIAEWKSKYFALKDEYESLSHDYDALLAQSQGAKQLGTDTREKDERIRSLEAEVNRLRNLQSSGGGGGGDGQPLVEAKRKIEKQNEEIQKLLEERVSYQTEITDLRMRPGTSVDVSHGGPTTAGGTFEQERMINNLRATLKEKNDEIEELVNNLEAAKGELSRLGGVMGLVADQVEKDEKKKKKTWWGGTKKKKQDPSKLTAAELDALARDASMIGGGLVETPRSATSGQEERSPILSTKDGKLPSASRAGGAPMGDLRLPRPASAPDLAGVVVNKRMLELERENARLEGEIDILEKEKQSVGDKLKRAEAQVEVLQKARKLDEANLKAISVSKSISIPLPKDGGSEADRLRVVVQLQEAALQRISLKGQQLEDTLEMYTNQQGDIEDRMAEKEGRIRDELSKAGQEVSTLKLAKHRLEEEVRLQQVKVAAYEGEVERLKNAIAHTQILSREGAAKLKNQSDSYALMLGNLLKDNKSLQNEWGSTRTMHAMDNKIYQGEVRALRDGRVQRLEGDPPDRRLFPSRPPDTTLPLRLRRLSDQQESLRVPPPSPAKSETVLSEGSLSDESLPPPSPPQIKDAPVVLPDQPPSIDQSISPTFRYAWTPTGYLLQPETPSPLKSSISPSRQTQGVSPTSTLRPVVTVEPRRGPGPFPAEMDPTTDVSPTTTGLIGYPEIDARDQALAQSALREWFNHPSVSQSRPISPDSTKTPEAGSRLQASSSRSPYSHGRQIRSPAPPARHRSPPRAPNDIPSHVLAFNPLESRSESKTSLEMDVSPGARSREQQQKVLSVPLDIQSDWGADVPAALLSFGRPTATRQIEQQQEQPSIRKETPPKRQGLETQPPPARPPGLGVFPPQYSLEPEPKKPLSPPMTTGISPPSISHPLLGQSDAGIQRPRQDQFQKMDIDVKSHSVGPSAGEKPSARPNRFEFPHPDSQRSLESIPKAFEQPPPLPKATVVQPKRTPSPPPPRPTQPPQRVSPKVQPVQAPSEAPKPLAAIQPVEPSPRFTSQDRTLGSEDSVGRRRLDSGSFEEYRRPLRDDDESYAEFRRIRQSSSNGRLVDDLSLGRESGDLESSSSISPLRPPSKQPPQPSTKQPVPATRPLAPPPSSSFSDDQYVPSPRFTPRNNKPPLSDSESSKFSFDEDLLPSPKALAAPSRPTTPSDRVVPSSLISFGPIRDSSRPSTASFAQDERSSLTSKRSTESKPVSSGTKDAYKSKRSLSSMGSLHPQDRMELGQAGELFGFTGKLEELGLDEEESSDQRTPARELSDQNSGSESYDLREQRSDSMDRKKGRLFNQNDSFLTDSFDSQPSTIKHTPNFDASRSRKSIGASRPNRKISAVQFPDLHSFSS